MTPVTPIPVVTDGPNPNEVTTSFERIPANQLVVDPSYQRPVSVAKVRKIVRNFDPDAIGVLLVSRRDNGQSVLIDGSHRTAAFMAMDGYATQTLPCQVYHGLTLEQEANLFVVYNRDRSKPSGYDVFRAAVTAGDPDSLDIKAVVGSKGLAIAGSNSGSAVSAIGALQRIYAAGGAKLLSETMDVCKAAWQPPDAYMGDMLTGVGIVLSRYPNADRRRLVGRVSTVTPRQLLAQAHAVRGSASTGGGGRLHAIVARQLVELYNWRLSDKHRLAWVETTAGRSIWSS